MQDQLAVVADGVAPPAAVPAYSTHSNVPPASTPEPVPESLLCRSGACIARAFRRCVKCPAQYCQEHMSERRFPDRDFVLPYRCGACLEAPTEGGVSYVVETESKGLGHIVYQVQNLSALPSQAMSDNWVALVKGESLVAVLADDDERLKDYLLRSDKRGAPTQTLSRLADITKLFQEKRALITHYTLGDTITASKGVNASDMQLVLIFRRAQIWSSRAKEGEEPLNEEERAEEDREKRQNAAINVRVEIFVNGNVWDALPLPQKRAIKYFQVLTDDFFGCIFDAINSRGLVGRTIQAVHTRDAFKIRLNPVHTPIPMGGGRFATKTVWYFPADSLPQGYNHLQYGALTPNGAPAGVITYNDFYSHEELSAIEKEADHTDEEGRAGKFDLLPNTRHETLRARRIVRTKYFFGARYLWTADQTKDKKESSKAGGIRLDVAPPPRWLKDRVEARLVSGGLISANWFNSYAINFYHDGTEGLHQHYDDRTRFNQPVFTVRLFSDSRLVFGAQGLAMTSATFFIPMPRGCITVLEHAGFAANGIKHCIRPADMRGKSAAVILRQIHPTIYAEAQRLLMEGEVVRFVTAIHGLENALAIAMTFQRINMDTVPHLTECDLKLMGVDKLGPRRLLMNAIEAERERKGLPPRAQCSCECNAAAEALRTRIVDPSPVVFKNLLLQFPWLADALKANQLPTHQQQPQSTTPHTPPVISYGGQRSVAPLPPMLSSASLSTSSDSSFAPSPLSSSSSSGSINSTLSPTEMQFSWSVRPRPQTPRITTPASSPRTPSLPSFPRTPSSVNSTQSSPLSASSPMEALQSEFWLTASPIAAPGTPLYVPSEDEIRRSSEGIADADKSRGQKRAAQNPLHRTA